MPVKRWRFISPPSRSRRWVGTRPAGPTTWTGSATLVLTDTTTTSGARKTFGSSVAAFIDAITTGGVRKAFGSSVTTLTDVIVTSGLRKAFGQSVVAETDAITTVGSRKTFGQSAAPLAANITTAGLINTTEAATVTLTLSPGSPVEVFTGADAAIGTLALTPSGTDVITPTVVELGTFRGNSGSLTSGSITIPAAGVAIGHTVILAVCCAGNRTVTAADSRGNPYAVNVTQINGTSLTVTLLSARVTTALLSGDTITVTPNTATNFAFGAYDVATLLSPAFDKSASAVGTGVTADSGATVTTTQADELLFAVHGWNATAGTYTVMDSTWAKPPTDPLITTVASIRLMGVEYKTVSATGTYNATGTYSGASTQWAAAIGTYKFGTGVAASDTGTGVLLLTASAADVGGLIDADTGVLAFTPSAAEVEVGVDAGTGVLAFTPSATEIREQVDTAITGLVFAPSGADTQIAVRQNSFEGGTSGTTISIANSGGASGNPFNLLTIGAGVTLEYNSAAAFVGSLGMRVVQPATGLTSFAGWNKLGPYDGNYWARIYFNVSAVNAQNTMISWRNIGDVAMCHIGINATGKIAVLAGSGAGTSQAPLISTINPAANTWYRLECRVNPTAGEFEWWIYNGHSTTALDTKAATGVVFPASSLVDGARIGVGTLSTWAANAITGLLDDIALSNVAKIGPSVGAIDYLDSGTATLAFTPTASEIREKTDAATGVVSLVPLSSEVFAATDSAIGTLALVPSATDAGQRVEVGNVAIVLAASSNDVLVATDSGTGQLALVPSGIEFSSAAGTDTGIEVFKFTPSASEAAQTTDTATTPVAFLPSGTESRVVTDANAASLSFTPSAAETQLTVDTATALVTLSPSPVEFFTGVDSATTPVVFLPSSSEGRESVDVAATILALSPGSIDVYERVDVATALLRFTPDSQEAGFIFFDAATVYLSLSGHAILFELSGAMRRIYGARIRHRLGRSGLYRPINSRLSRVYSGGMHD